MATAKVGKVVIKEVGEPVPIAVTGTPRDLSPEGQREIRELMRREPGRFLFQLSWNWLRMLSAIASAVYFQNVALSVFVVLFVGTRQNVLAVLLHEQVHKSAFQSRFGEYLTNLFVAYPLGVTLEQYRRVHLAHHQGFFTDRDPDFARKQGEDWTFPQLAWRFVKNVVRDLLALNLWNTIKSKGLEEPSANAKYSGMPQWLRPLFYVALFGVLSLFQGWAPFLLFWVLPWATVLQAIIRWAAICEHKYNLVHPSVSEATPLIMLRWWERAILPNLNFTTYHIYHHFYPKIPWSKLPAVHEIFRREGLVDEKHIFRGVTGYLDFLLLKVPAQKKTEQQSLAAPFVSPKSE